MNSREKKRNSEEDANTMISSAVRDSDLNIVISLAVKDAKIVISSAVK